MNTELKIYIYARCEGACLVAGQLHSASCQKRGELIGRDPNHLIVSGTSA